MSVDLTRIDPSRVSVEKSKSVDLTQVPKERISTEPDVMGESLSAGVKAAEDTKPKLGILPAWERGQAVGRAALHGLQSDGPLAMPNPLAALQEAIAQAKSGNPDSAPSIQNLMDQNVGGRLVQNEGFKKSFADTQTPIRAMLSPAMGWDKAGGAVGEAPATAARSLIGAETDPVSYIPAEAVVGMVPKPVRNAVSKAFEAVPKKLAKGAEKLTENATGATGRMKDKLRPGTGRELLDRGLIKFGDTAESLGRRASTEMERAGEEIGAALKALDESGTHVEKKKIIDQLTQRLDSLNADPDSRPIARKLQKIIEDFQAKEVSETMSLSRAEKVKRGYDRKANYLKPNTTEAQKEAAGLLRGEVEKVATEANPALAEKFKKEKETFGLLKPVVDVAEHRAAQLQQSPYGGLLDVSTGMGGAMMGNSLPAKALGGALGLVGRRQLVPRFAASSAVTADTLAKALVKMGVDPIDAVNVIKLAPGLLKGASRP